MTLMTLTAYFRMVVDNELDYSRVAQIRVAAKWLCRLAEVTVLPKLERGMTSEKRTGEIFTSEAKIVELFQTLSAKQRLQEWGKSACSLAFALPFAGLFQDNFFQTPRRDKPISFGIV
jgi:hypothetical protein